MPRTTVDVRLNLRPHQLAAHRTEQRFQVNVWHRRAGKTFYSVGKKLVRALQSTRNDYRAFYIAPTFKQAKAVSWDYLKRFAGPIPGTSVNEAELRIDLPGGSRIQLLGAEQFDALRGRYADDLTIDETAMIPTSAWNTVLSPMLADRKGRATFIGTPMGRMNLFFDLYEYASGDDDEWGSSLLTYRDTGVLDSREIDRLRRTMRPEEFAQEMECSWNAAIRGAYYAREMSAAEAEGRVTTVRYDRTLPVTAAVDLGWSDAMVVVFHQQAGTEHRILMARAYEQTSIPDMIRDWRTLPFPIDTVVLPHDAKVRELGTGKSRQETFHSLGCSTVLCPSQSIHEGISAVRDFLPNAWFDREGCKTLIEAMLAYRSEFDEVKNVHRLTPVHDWSSHWADAFRYLALGRPHNASGWGERPAFQGGIYA
jgi:hypothetical protein